MVPNKPNMTTIICRKFPRMGAHWKPRKSKICLSRAEICNQTNVVYWCYLYSIASSSCTPSYRNVSAYSILIVLVEFNISTFISSFLNFSPPFFFFLPSFFSLSSFPSFFYAVLVIKLKWSWVME